VKHEGRQRDVSKNLLVSVDTVQAEDKDHRKHRKAQTNITKRTGKIQMFQFVHLREVLHGVRSARGGHVIACNRSVLQSNKGEKEIKN